MTELKKRFAMLIEMFTKHMAIAGCGAASHWCVYQMKEPKNIYKK